MSVVAIGEYEFEAKDKLENFHGNQVVYINWEKHLMFCAPLAFPLSPDMPFGDLVNGLLPQFYGPHQDWEKVDWVKATWLLDGAPFEPDLGKSLADNGVGHKSVLRFTTPGLDGIKGSAS